uniref:Uncharacterized protein n=1 Tax=Octopus bimaculoides TaxID=37653 RepID=A0A0L8FS90_OCTBM
MYAKVNHLELFQTHSHVSAFTYASMEKDLLLSVKLMSYSIMFQMVVLNHLWPNVHEFLQEDHEAILEINKFESIYQGLLITGNFQFVGKILYLITFYEYLKCIKFNFSLQFV